jgi:DNA polymerase-1
MLVTALEGIKPDQVVVAWDLPVPTFRHEKYVAYKAQRAKADEEMVEQIPTVKEVIEVMGLVQLAKERYEADDIIGTLARESVNEVVILSGDMDLTQLVNERVTMLTPPRGRVPAKLYGPEEVEEKYGVKPKQIVDYKALVGDASDNIPGVRGIGPKTAAGLIQEYGTLPGIYANLTNIPEKARQKLIEGKDSAYLSQELSRIETGMKLEVEEEALEYRGVGGEKLKSKLEELNFRSLIRRLWKEEDKPQEVDIQMGLF